MKKVSLVSVLILFALVSFAQNPLTINGNLKNPPTGNIILKHYDAARQYAIDSTAISPDGGFVFSVKNPQGGLYLLEYNGQYIGYIFPSKGTECKLVG
jgi:hypothetical protein